MGQADYYSEGDWNFRCMECWKKMKSSQALRRWDGCWVGPECYELRNPQDFARGIPDRQDLPWNAPNPPNNYIDGNTDPTQSAAGNMMLDVYRLNSRPLG